MIEDDESLIEAFASAVNERIQTPHAIAVARNRAEALATLGAADHYDVILCDLRIPSVAGALDAQAEFGQEVFGVAREVRPGTPTWVVTGYADDAFYERMLVEQRIGCPFGSREDVPMVLHYRKAHIADVLTALVALALEVESLRNIDLTKSGQEIVFNDEEERMLRIVTRRLGGTTGRLTPLAPGLSGSKTVRLEVVDAHGAHVARCVVKIGQRASLEDEAARYHAWVPNRLTAGSFAPIFEKYLDGARDIAALGYSVAAADPRSLAELLSEDPVAAAETVTMLRASERPWREGCHTEQLGVDALCDLLGSPTPLSAPGLTIDADAAARLSAMTVQARIGPQHGDLHVSNVLLEGTTHPVLIDYGRTGQRVSAYDAVTLEMCLAFHPGARARAGGWPSSTQAAAWDALDPYLDGCPFPGYVRACREWAHDVANGDREVFVAVLSYALRQLLFPGTDHDLARAFAFRSVELLTR